jgi:hypothetical protein
VSDYYVAQPGTLPAAPPVQDRLREDLRAFGLIVIGSVLLGAPAGLIWSRVAPHLTVTVNKDGVSADNLESTKAFIGADGSYLVVMLVMGLICGGMAWWLARRSGPFTVAALVVGGVLAALIAASVGLRPGTGHAIAALKEGTSFRGTTELFLGVRHGDGTKLRAPWAAVGWPVGALLVFVAGGLWKPEELD